MAFDLISNTLVRQPLGNRWMVYATVDEVDNSGSFVAAGDLELTSIESVVATVKEAAVAVQAVANSQDGSADGNNGDLFLKTASGTHDVYVQIIGKG